MSESQKTNVIFKIMPAALWDEAKRENIFRGSSLDLSDGFIHFSTAAQLDETARKFFTGERDLVLLTIDADRLAVTWEPSRGGVLFPHLYGTLSLDSVLSVEEFEVPGSLLDRT